MLGGSETGACHNLSRLLLDLAHVLFLSLSIFSFLSFHRGMFMSSGNYGWWAQSFSDFRETSFLKCNRVT